MAIAATGVSATGALALVIVPLILVLVVVLIAVLIIIRAVVLITERVLCTILRKSWASVDGQVIHRPHSPTNPAKKRWKVAEDRANIAGTVVTMSGIFVTVTTGSVDGSLQIS